MSDSDAGAERIQTPMGEVVITQHKDARGESGKWLCGCSVLRRGGTYKRRYCDRHGTLSRQSSEAPE